MGGGQDKPAWTACPLGVKITRVGGKITREQAVQGGKINCYTGGRKIALSELCSGELKRSLFAFQVGRKNLFFALPVQEKKYF